MVSEWHAAATGCFRLRFFLLGIPSPLPSTLAAHPYLGPRCAATSGGKVRCGSFSSARKGGRLGS